MGFSGKFMSNDIKYYNIKLVGVNILCIYISRKSTDYASNRSKILQKAPMKFSCYKPKVQYENWGTGNTIQRPAHIVLKIFHFSLKYQNYTMHMLNNKKKTVLGYRMWS